MSNWIVALHICIVVLVSFANVSFAQEPADSQDQWCGSYADGTPLCYDELMELIEKHQRWLERDEVGRQEHIDERLDLGSDYSEVDYHEYHERHPGKVPAQALGADLSGVFLENVNISESRLSYCVLENAYFSDIDATRALMVGISIENAQITKSVFDNCYMYDACFINANIQRTSFRDAYMRFADLTNSILVNVSLAKSALSYSLFVGSSLISVDMDNCHMGAAYFEPLIPFNIVNANTIRQLEWAQFRDGHSAALFELRRKLIADGHDDMADRISVAIYLNTREGTLLDRLYDQLFGVTCRFGVEPYLIWKSYLSACVYFFLVYLAMFFSGKGLLIHGRLGVNGRKDCTGRPSFWILVFMSSMLSVFAPFDFRKNRFQVLDAVLFVFRVPYVLSFKKWKTVLWIHRLYIWYLVLLFAIVVCCNPILLLLNS